MQKVSALSKRKKNKLEKLCLRVFLSIKLNTFDDEILFSELAAKMYGGRFNFHSVYSCI